MEPSAWQPGQPCYEPLYTKVCKNLFQHFKFSYFNFQPCPWGPKPELQSIKPDLPAHVTVPSISLVTKLQPDQPSVLPNKPLILANQPKLQSHISILFTNQPKLQSYQS